jgi:hypothetical protein
MGMGWKKKREEHQELWGATNDIVCTPGHAFYERLNTVMEAERFDQRGEVLCWRYYKSESGYLVPHAVAGLLRGDRLRGGIARRATR